MIATVNRTKILLNVEFMICGVLYLFVLLASYFFLYLSPYIFCLCVFLLILPLYELLMPTKIEVLKMLKILAIGVM